MFKKALFIPLYNIFFSEATTVNTDIKCVMFYWCILLLKRTLFIKPFFCLRTTSNSRSLDVVFSQDSSDEYGLYFIWKPSNVCFSNHVLSKLTKQILAISFFKFYPLLSQNRRSVNSSIKYLVNHHCGHSGVYHDPRS